MSEMSKKAREALKAKARRLAAPGTLEKDQNTTQADWTPAEALNADVKTGARPVGKARLYKKGGKVVGKVAGEKGAFRADRKPRKSGGRALEKEIGVGMSNKDVREANEQREGIKHVGAFKKGGKAKCATGGSIPSAKETEDNKQRLGTMKIKPERGAAGHYKKGGKIKKAGGGSFLEKMVGKPKTGSDMSQVGKMGSARYPTEEKETMKEIISPRDTTKETVETMERLGEAGRKKGGRACRDDGGSVKIPKATHKFDSSGEIIPPSRYDIYNTRTGKIVGKAKSRTGSSRAVDRRDNDYGAYAHRAVPVYDDAPNNGSDSDRDGRATGGRTKSRSKKGQTHINIVIAAGKEKDKPDLPLDLGGMPPDLGAMPPMPAGAPAPMPAGAPAPMPVPMPMPINISTDRGRDMMGRKAGGRITKVAKSYKDMEAGAASGEGRLQKTDIEKRGKDAPARKAGGRIYRSYKNMDAGAGSGIGREEKTEIQKHKKVRGK